MTSKRSPRTALIIIAALFFAPLLLAWLMYSGTISWQPASTRNLGQLVDPPIPVAWEDLEVHPGPEGPGAGPAEVLGGHWVILHPLPRPCLEPCIGTVTTLRQIHRATGRNQSRVRVALLAEPGRVAAEAPRLREIYPDFVLVTDRGGDFTAVLQRARPVGGSYLVDPLGNIMMAYPDGADPNDLKQDLKRLLTWSKLDE